MNPRARLAVVVALSALVCGGAAACLERGPEDLLGNAAPDALDRQRWTVIMADDAGEVWIAQTDSALAVHADAPELATADLWSVLDSEPDVRGATLSAQVNGRRMQWTLSNAGATIATGAGGLYSYVGNAGAPRFAGSATLTLNGTAHSLRFDAIGGLPMPDTLARLRPRPARHVLRAPGIVSIRIDDCGALDTASLGALERYHLVASFAVPTRLMGRPTSCSRALLARIAADGNAVEAHSRFHGPEPQSFADFYLETIGALLDLRSLGYDPIEFVAPGSWKRGPALFDSPEKLRSPYGALLRRAFSGIEAYQQPSTMVTIPTDGTQWPSPREITFLSVDQVDAYSRQAATEGAWIEFMWHSGAEPRAKLESKLARIAALRDSGAIENLPFRTALTSVPGTP